MRGASSSLGMMREMGTLRALPNVIVVGP